MRYLELLIDEVRSETGNQRYDADSGVSQRTMRQRLQNAQDFIIRAVVLSKSKYFLEPSTVTVVSGQETYDYPENCYMQGIDTIQWSSNGINWSDPLIKNIPKDKITTQNGYPFGYIAERRGIKLCPPISSGYLLVTANISPKRLEKRSGKISAVTGTPITSLTLDATYAGHDPTYLNQFQSITIVGADGSPKTDSIPITAVSGTTVTVTSYTLASGEAVAAGDYVLAQGNSTNLPDLDDTFESFLILHATYQTKYGDSSQWTQATKDDVKDHAQQIISVLGSMAEDVVQIPIISTDYLIID